jgi:hypothetical protein
MEYVKNLDIIFKSLGSALFLNHCTRVKIVIIQTLKNTTGPRFNFEPGFS